jgi:hypothetical protein
MRETGMKTKGMVRANVVILMVIHMMAIGKMMRGSARG